MSPEEFHQQEQKNGENTEEKNTESTEKKDKNEKDERDGETRRERIIKDKIQDLPLSDEQKKRVVNVFGDPENHTESSLEEIIEAIDESTSSEEIEDIISNLEQEVKTINIANNDKDNSNGVTAESNTKNKINGEINIEDIINKTEEADKKIIEAVNALKNLYGLIDNKYKPNEEEKRQRISEIENNNTIKTKLKAQGIDINTYVEYSITRDKILTTGTKTQNQNEILFIETLNQLDNYLGIPRETAKGFPLNYNENLKTPGTEALKNDQRISSLENETNIGNDIQSLEEYLAIAKLYGFKGEYNEEELKNLQKKAEISELTGEEKQKILDFIGNKELNEIKEKHNNRIKNYVTGYASQLPIFSIINYLDYTNNPGEEKLINKLSKTNGNENLLNSRVDIGKNGEIKIKGFIEGNPITLYYNLNGGHHNLSCDDTLNIENNIISLNKEGKTDLKINMPTLDEIVNSLKKIPYNEILKKSENIEEYQKTITEALKIKTEKIFPDNKEVKKRINKNIEKNLTTQTVCKTLIPERFQSEIENKLKESSSETPLKRMLTLIDNTTEFNSINKLNSIKQGFSKLNKFIKTCNINFEDPQNPINRIKEPLKKYIKELKIASETENYTEWENNIIEFISIFITTEEKGRNFSINPEALNTLTQHLEDEQTFKDSELEGFSDNFKSECILGEIENLDI